MKRGERESYDLFIFLLKLNQPSKKQCQAQDQQRQNVEIKDTTKSRGEGIRYLI